MRKKRGKVGKEVYFSFDRGSSRVLLSSTNECALLPTLRFAGFSPTPPPDCSCGSPPVPSSYSRTCNCAPYHSDAHRSINRHNGRGILSIRPVFCTFDNDLASWPRAPTRSHCHYHPEPPDSLQNSMQKWMGFGPQRHFRTLPPTRHRWPSRRLRAICPPPPLQRRPSRQPPLRKSRRQKKQGCWSRCESLPVSAGFGP
jgi:hypothetical protein